MSENLSTLRRMIARVENRPNTLQSLDKKPDLDRNPGLDENASPSPVFQPARQDVLGNLNKNKISTYGFSNLATGVGAIDGLFAGHGLAGNALHEIHAPEARAVGAATGFLAGLLVRLAQTESSADSDPAGIGLYKPVLWVQDPTSAREAGRLHAPGLYAFGFDPRRVITLAARSMQETLWALEEGLSCQGLGAVVGDIRGHSRALDLTATRRLTLRAEKARRPVLFLKTSAPEDTSAARSRWRIAPAPSSPLGAYQNGLGYAAWRLELTKNRDGPTGNWTLEWNHHDQSFNLVTANLVTADSGALVAAPADRSAGAPRMGRVVALRNVG